MVVPSLAEQDPEKQQDRGREAHPDEILHRVVWDEDVTWVMIAGVQ